MPDVKYGKAVIEYNIQEKPDLQSHYITVSKAEGVTLKGKPVSPQQADQFILKKAKWILDKLEVVRSVKEDDIVTGSRIAYLGRKYYVEVVYNTELKGAAIEFNHSRFRIEVNPSMEVQPAIQEALEQFFKDKAIKRITPRIRKWSKDTGLVYNELKFIRMDKRWGSCTGTNNIIINPEVIKLPFSLIDYVIVHELCHTKVKNHSKEFWAELSKHLGQWKELDAKMEDVRL